MSPQFAGVPGRRCQLREPVLDRNGHTRFKERPRIVREVSIFGRGMYLVQFKDGGLAFLFPEQIAFHSGDHRDA